MGLKNIKHRLMENSRKNKYLCFMCFIENDDASILDVGVNTIEHSPIDNYLEKHYPKLANVTALSITPAQDFSKKYPVVKFVKYDGGQFPFDDGVFDYVHSNAVIEHVGNSSKQEEFIKEMLRVSRKGVFFTTPNKFFPIEMHTNLPLLHYLPKVLFDKLLYLFRKQWASGDYMHLLSIATLNARIKNVCLENNLDVNVDIKKERLFGFVYQLVVTMKKII
jgi:hypothetical protein